MTPDSREAMEKAWSERRDLKYDPLSLDVIAEGEYKGGWRGAAEFYEKHTRDKVHVFQGIEYVLMPAEELDRLLNEHAEELKSMRKHYEKIVDEMKSPPAQESSEVREMAEAARLVANQFLFSPDKGMESMDNYALAHERLNAAVAAYDAKKGGRLT